MADLPPRFLTDLEDSLLTPSQVSFISRSSSRQDVEVASTNGSTRRWDDPPEQEPVSPTDFVQSIVIRFIMRISRAPLATVFAAEITHVTFTPLDTHITTVVQKSSLQKLITPAGPMTLATFHADSGARLPNPVIAYRNWGDDQVSVNGAPAFMPLSAAGASLIVACAFYMIEPHMERTGLGRLPPLCPWVEVFDLTEGKRERLVKWAEAPIRAPLAWCGDGRYLAGVSVRDPRRVVVTSISFRAGASGKRKDLGTGKIEFMFSRHDDEVLHLAWLPIGAKGDGRWMAAGTKALVTVGKDGFVRITDALTGKTLKKLEVGARSPPSMLQVSPAGDMVVTVWGRDVILWYLDENRVHRHSLNDTRLTEGWPLCISPDCRYLACQTEDGFDICDLETGKFRGEYARRDLPQVTAAAFDNSGTRIVVATLSGSVEFFRLVS